MARGTWIGVWICFFPSWKRKYAQHSHQPSHTKVSRTNERRQSFAWLSWPHLLCCLSALPPLWKRMNIDGIDFVFRIIAGNVLTPGWAFLFTYHPGIISGAESHCAHEHLCHLVISGKDAPLSLLMMIEFYQGTLYKEIFIIKINLLTVIFLGISQKWHIMKILLPRFI